MCQSLLRLSALVSVVVVVGCGGGGTAPVNPPQPPQTPLVSPGTWVVLGSSTAAGVGAASGESWVSRLQALAAPAAVSLQSLARSGLLTSQALPAGTTVVAPEQPPVSESNIERALAASPKLVLLSFPTNDAVVGVPASQTLANLRRLRDLAAQAGAATLVLGSQPREQLNQSQQSALDAMDSGARSAFGPCFVELRARLANAQGGIAAEVAAGDGVHLNGEGHRRIAELLRERLNAGSCVRVTSPL